jgi:hypothetical protein
LSTLLVCLYLFRGPLLRGAAHLFIVDDAIEPADALLILGSGNAFCTPEEHEYDEPARLHAAGIVKKILVIEEHGDRLTRLKILPSEVDLAQANLQKRGVPAGDIVVLPADVWDTWDKARRFHAWLEDNPGTKAIVLSESFSSRGRRAVFAAILGKDMTRVRWHSVPSRQVEEHDWWTNRHGLVWSSTYFLYWCHVRLFGEDPAPRRQWDPDEYEKKLRMKDESDKG